MYALIKKAAHKDNRLIIIAITVLIAIIIALQLHGNRAISEIYTVIDNPTFIGEVADREVIIRRTGHGVGWEHHQFFLHIVGSYIYDDETIYVDRYFPVPQYLFHQFNIGDVISH